MMLLSLNCMFLLQAKSASLTFSMGCIHKVSEKRTRKPRKRTYVVRARRTNSFQLALINSIDRNFLYGASTRAWDV
jgi:hypothetical protein